MVRRDGADFLHIGGGLSRCQQAFPAAQANPWLLPILAARGPRGRRPAHSPGGPSRNWRLLAVNLENTIVEALAAGATLEVIFLAVELHGSRGGGHGGLGQQPAAQPAACAGGLAWCNAADASVPGRSGTGWRRSFRRPTGSRAT
jgi:hypothetical protein